MMTNTENESTKKMSFTRYHRYDRFGIGNHASAILAFLKLPLEENICADG